MIPLCRRFQFQSMMNLWAPAAPKKNVMSNITFCQTLAVMRDLLSLTVTQSVSIFGHSNCQCHHYYCSKYHYLFIRRMEMAKMLNCTSLPFTTQISKGNHSIWITITRQFSFYIKYLYYFCFEWCFVKVEGKE